MEDAHCVTQFHDLPGLFIGVYDGHGGSTVAHALAHQLHAYFLDALLPEPQPLPPLPPSSPLSIPAHHHTPDNKPPPPLVSTHESCGSPLSTPPCDEPMMPNKRPHVTYPPPVCEPVDDEAAFRVAYRRMDAALRRRRCARVGATAVTCFVRWEQGVGRVLTTANCGDARAVLSRGGRVVRLSEDHRPAEEGERGRVEKGGGFVMGGRVNGVLNVSRAFGDFAMKSVVVATPAVRRVVLGDMDEFVVVACDGLWDFVDEREVVAVVRSALDRGMDAAQVAAVLVRLALERKGTDNVTVVVVVLQRDE
eukprot:GFKZ01013087.1.p1 GENE.GFKZ01013087.1~~GFKZ01013087.1.p1  ORF type:complete len:335 (+),score=49.77 GFKZ01013087.1:87-1007(+)